MTKNNGEEWYAATLLVILACIVMLAVDFYIGVYMALDWFMQSLGAYLERQDG